MDPISIVGLVGTVVGLITRNLQGLINLQSKYRYSSLVLTLLIGQLTTLKAAVNHITEWVSTSLINLPENEQLVADIQVALESCHVLIIVLEERIDEVEKEYAGGNLGIKGKAWFLAVESSLTEFSGHLNNQVNALNLLLTAFQCRTTFERNELLEEDESRETIKIVKDDRTSLLTLRGTGSASARTSIAIASDTFSLISRDFDFDQHILSTDVYREAWRSNMRKAMRTWKGKMPEMNRSLMNDDELDDIIISSPIPINQESADTELPVLDPVEDVLQELGPMREDDIFPLLTPSNPRVESKRGTRVVTRGPATLENTTMPSIPETTVTSRASLSSPDWAKLPDLAADPLIFHDRTKVKNFTAWKSRIPKILGVSGRQKVRQSFFTLGNGKRQSIEDLPEEQLCSDFKVLILGSSESGKSTFFKSIKLAYEGGFSRDERISFKEIIFSNTVRSMRLILEAMEGFEIPLEKQQNESHVTSIFMEPHQIESDIFPEGAGRAVEELWKDSAVRAVFNRSNEYQLKDTAPYFFNHIERLVHPTYMPTTKDVLMSRVKTTGITETTFLAHYNTVLRVFDVGGRRSERKKWIHCFENVDAVILPVDLASYNQKTFEDESTNRLQEDLQLLEAIINSPWFSKTEFALVFTKMDKLATKIKKAPLQEYFEDYEGGDDLEAAKAYLTKRFLSLDRQGKDISVYYVSVEDGLEASSIYRIFSGLIESSRHKAPII